MIGETGKESLDCIQHDALGADAINGVPEPDKEPLEIILSRFFDFATLDVHVVKQYKLLRDQFFEIEAKRANIGCEFGRTLLKHHENARLVKLGRAAHDEFHRKHGLSTARCTADEGGPP